ncbi:DUF971 domain-containing protein [Piscinibacter sp. XHJ-5]|uniref:DUF971 domain-containing protein n=1 Tax=Piscinibacter sp. XHJ-5 TaxID=3037797 RepID=UPI00245323DB|nr:DUF971 domain-containing protein [Piscinibacter sp. XHJ-5]
MSAAPFPEAIELEVAHLRLRWPDGDTVLPAQALRAECRCAHCRAALLGGHPSPVYRGIALTDAKLVGQYALQLSFSDGHARGIYPWPLLRELGSRGTDTSP